MKADGRDISGSSTANIFGRLEELIKEINRLRGVSILGLPMLDASLPRSAKSMEEMERMAEEFRRLSVSLENLAGFIDERFGIKNDQ